MALSAFVGVGNIFAGRAGELPDQKLTLSTDGCPLVNNTGSKTLNEIRYVSIGDWKEDHADDSGLMKLWSISFLWQPAVGILSTIILGMICSGIVILFQKNEPKKVNHSLLSPPFIKLWQKIFGQKRINRWIDFDSPPFSGDPAKKKAKNNNNEWESKS